jgi:hypothetical protein
MPPEVRRARAGGCRSVRAAAIMEVEHNHHREGVHTMMRNTPTTTFSVNRETGDIQWSPGLAKWRPAQWSELRVPLDYSTRDLSEYLSKSS